MTKIGDACNLSDKFYSSRELTKSAGMLLIFWKSFIRACSETKIRVACNLPDKFFSSKFRTSGELTENYENWGCL